METMYRYVCVNLESIDCYSPEVRIDLEVSGKLSRIVFFFLSKKDIIERTIISGEVVNVSLCK